MRKPTRILAALIVAAMAISSPLPALASEREHEEIIDYDVGGYSRYSTLYVNGTTADCRSYQSGNSSNVSSIDVTQNLQKVNSDGKFETIYTWSTSSSSSNVYFQNYKYSLGTGVYRVESIFTTTLTNGQSQSVTVYSTSKVI